MGSENKVRPPASFLSVFLDQTKENLGQYILNPLLYIEGTIARGVRGGIRNDLDLHQALK